MSAPLRIQDLPVEEIAELLEKEGQKVPPSLAADLKVLIDEMGGIDSAYTAVERVRKLEAAA